MWSVLRRQQGEEYDPSPPTRGEYVENANHIARFECKPNPQPLDPHLLTEPYGVRVYQKLINNLSSPDLILRRKAVSALILYFGQKIDHVARTIEYGGIAALIAALKDEDQKVRVDACIAIAKVVAHPSGQEHVLAEKMEVDLKQAVYDDPPVAVQALKTLQAMDAHWNDRAGTKALIACECIDLYIKMAGEGTDEVKAEALKALAKVYNVKESFIKVLFAGAMPVLTNLLASTSKDVVEHAADNIALLCFYSAGKRAAVEDPNTAKRLITLMGYEDTLVRQAVSAALMGITIDNVGKDLVISHGGIEQILDRVQNEVDDTVLINVIKTICNASENPAARPPLLACVMQLQTIKEERGANTVLANTATRAIEMITWKP